jgi:hypothetical protein
MNIYFCVTLQSSMHVDSKPVSLQYTSLITNLNFYVSMTYYFQFSTTTSIPTLSFSSYLCLEKNSYVSFMISPAFVLESKTISSFLTIIHNINSKEIYFW